MNAGAHPSPVETKGFSGTDGAVAAVGHDETFHAISYAFRVTTNVPEVPQLLAALLTDLRGATGDQAHHYELLEEAAERPFAAYVDGTLIRRVSSPLALVDELLWHANREAILRPDPRIAVHASGVVWNGRGLLFPAPANSGKTTLVVGLLCRGATYLTDEAALIDPITGEAHPYPKPMWLSPGAVRAVSGLRERLLPEYRLLSRIRAYVTPRDLGTTVAGGPARVDLVIAPTYREGASTSLELTSRAAGLMALANNAFDLARFGRPGILTLARLIEGARCYRLVIGEHDPAAQAVARLIGGGLADA